MGGRAREISPRQSTGTAEAAAGSEVTRRAIGRRERGRPGSSPPPRRIFSSQRGSRQRHARHVRPPRRGSDRESCATWAAARDWPVSAVARGRKKGPDPGAVTSPGSGCRGGCRFGLQPGRARGSPLPPQLSSSPLLPPRLSTKPNHRPSGLLLCTAPMNARWLSSCEKRLAPPDRLRRVWTSSEDGRWWLRRPGGE